MSEGRGRDLVRAVMPIGVHSAGDVRRPFLSIPGPTSHAGQRHQRPMAQPIIRSRGPRLAPPAGAGGTWPGSRTSSARRDAATSRLPGVGHRRVEAASSTRSHRATACSPDAVKQTFSTASRRRRRRRYGIEVERIDVAYGEACRRRGRSPSGRRRGARAARGARRARTRRRPASRRTCAPSGARAMDPRASSRAPAGGHLGVVARVDQFEYTTERAFDVRFTDRARRRA